MAFRFTDLFTFLKEGKLFIAAKEGIAKIIASKKDDFKAYAEVYVKEKSPAVKDVVVSFIMDHIELKFPYKFFKGSIKKIINKNFDRIIEFILVKLQEV